MSTKNNISTYLPYIIVLIGFVVLMVLYAFEFDYFNRTFKASTLATWSIIIGVIMGLFLAWRLARKTSDTIERVQITLLCILGIALFMPLFASLSNRLLSFQSARQVPVEFVEQEPYVSGRFGILEAEHPQPTGYRTFFYYNNHLQRIQTEHTLFPDALRGDTVQLAIKKGLWGFEFVPK